MVGNELAIVPSVIKRGEDVKQLHASQGINPAVFQFNKLTLPIGWKAVTKFQEAIDKAYETLAKEMQAVEGGKMVAVIGEDQFSTMVHLAKEEVKNNPFPADIQSLAHRTNLTEAGTVTVWAVEKSGGLVAKANLASGFKLG